MKAIGVLEGKRRNLQSEFPHIDNLDRAITAAYNCGEGNVARAIRKGIDIDSYTFNKDYSKEVWRFREIYKTV